MLYVKDGIHYKRRGDLEIRAIAIESIWIEIANNHKRILFGLFYRPPNSNANYYSNIEDSLSLAVDIGINDIIVTGDFNLNLLNPLTSKKIDSLCTQFALHQSNNQPTHFTETSSSIIDILLVSNKDNLILSGVGDPFLGQELRYHCPIYGIFKFSKTKVHSFMRHILSYDHADFNLLRSKAESIDWTSLQDDDINVYANNTNKTINNIASECIPNRYVRIRPSDSPWITSEIKLNIRTP